MGTQSTRQVQDAFAATNTLTLKVVSARTEPLAFDGAGVIKGDPVPEYQYIINIDNTGQTVQRTPGEGCSPEDPDYPGSCQWVSIAGAASSSPIFTQGNQNDLINGLNLPDGRYLISVLADGYKMDGTHFTVPLPDPDPLTGANVIVELQPHPLPTATIQAAIFEDISPTNGAPDAPIEHGLAGFQGHIVDYLGEITTDIFGDPICGDGVCVSKCYVVNNGLDLGTVAPIDGAGRCPLDTTGLTITLEGDPIPDGSEVQGKLIIPNLGPNRYGLSVVSPDGSTWTQTTTLEGNLEYDTWVMEGATGLDTEFVVAGEPFPASFFGYVLPTSLPPSAATGQITGVVAAYKVYVPAGGGLPLIGTIWGGLSGGKIDKPIEYPWVSLSDLNNGDTVIYAGQGDVNGVFNIQNVPDGNYILTYWDTNLNYILDLVNVTVSNGETVDMGVLPLTGWWTKLDGYVFNDLNRNGVKDPGEPGIANYTLTLRKRENSLIDRGAKAVTTDATGYWVMENAYPMTQWLVLEAYNDLYYTTGITYQADNQPTPTTLMGSGVDVSVLPIIGLAGRVDWGVHAYDATGATGGVDPRNGGIVGTVSYDTTRNELDPRYAAVEDWQPGISNLVVNLYAPVFCGTNPGTPCDASGFYELASDGSYAKGQLLNTYLTETWQRPGLNDDGICIPRDVDGNPLTYPDDQQVTNSPSDCLEGPLMGVQFQNGFSTVDGNYGFADGCFDGTLDATDPANPECVGGAFAPLPGGRDYLVEIQVPSDALGRPQYKVTREEDINIANGDDWIPQVPPPACAGALHIVDVAGIGTDGYPAVDYGNGIIVPASTPTDNATFAEIGGTPYEGLVKPLCDTKLVPLNNGRSIVPTFNFFTDVPLPGRFWGYIVDDLNFSGNPKSLLFGEKAGIPFVPVGIYDYTNRLIATVESDYNGLYEVLVPSTNRISCPTPSGVCTNLYRFVGNDPGIPGKLNPNYKPEFRTISAPFEAFAGLIVITDLAPTQVGVVVQLPGGGLDAVSCSLDPTTPQLLAVSQPYADVSAGDGSFTIQGVGFGAAQGEVSLDGTPLPVTLWTETQIDVTVPATTPTGSHQLHIVGDNGQQTVNGLTFHVLHSGAIGAFPSTSILDDFNRADTTDGFGGGWSDNVPPSAALALIVSTNEARVRTNPNNNNNNVIRNAWLGTTYGADQEAYFTFTQVSNRANANEQGVLLKFTGTTPTNSNASWIEVAYNNTPANTVRVRTKSSGSGTITDWLTITGVTFGTNDQLGARALSDGTVLVFKNGVQIGSVNIPATATWTGRIGVRFEGTGNTASTEARFDNFGGGNLVVPVAYYPNLYEVGSGYPYVSIQSALDDAAASEGEDLVVVYPGEPDFSNPRYNPRGAYYENPIIYAPVKLQGVGPGGFQGTTFIPGSILDGGAIGGDTPLAEAWRIKVESLTWDGNQNVNEGQVLYILAEDGEFTADFPASIDGFDIRGGDQMGFPNNINQIGGGNNGLPPNVTNQGGAIFANAYARHLQITNNMIQNNGGSYGTIRIGTPDLSPDASSYNENVRIAHNRIILNGGTNLAGGIGLFAGADNYEVAYNDLCGNFSAEYGGGLTVYGYSPNGSIHDNRIYFNSSYDEGGGIMIAGQLPADPTTLSPGAGPVDIFNNLIQANMSNDDGGGIRFLMAGNFPMNVFNNLIVNNVSTHEGGGISLNDAPDVRVFNNTIMKNLTTATAATGNGLPAPAGLSTSQNSALLQATLPGGAPIFSNPVLFNNIFWDNRAGTLGLGTVSGLGIAGDPSPIHYWDMGVADYTGLLSPTYSVLQTTDGTNLDPSNQLSDPTVIAPYDVSVSFNGWRTNPNFIGAILVAVEAPPNLMGNYHLPDTSVAVGTGVATQAGINAPAFDIDGDGRPSDGFYEMGADELAGPVSAFPFTPVLDDFNRPDGGLGSNWGGNTAGAFGLSNNQVLLSNSGSMSWNSAFGANQEAYLTFTALSATSTEQALILKFNGTSPSATKASLIEVVYDAAAGMVRIRTHANRQGWIEQAAFPATFAPGDTFGARALFDGTVSVFKNGVLIGSINVTLTSNPWAVALAQGGGKTGVWFTNANGATFDNFGGGTMP